MAHLGYRTTNWTRIQNSNTSKKKKSRGEYDFEIVVTDSQRRTISRETVWVDSFDEAVAIARSKKYEVPKDHTVHCDGVEVSFFG